MHPICGTHWEAKLHTETSTLVSILCPYGCFYCFYCVLWLFVFLVFIPSAFVCSLLSFLFLPSCAFACVICKALWVAVGYEMCHVKKFALPYIHTSTHPSILSGSYASGPIRCPSCSTLPNPPPKHTNTVSTVSTDAHTSIQLRFVDIIQVACLACSARWHLCMRCVSERDDLPS